MMMMMLACCLLRAACCVLRAAVPALACQPREESKERTLAVLNVSRSEPLVCMPLKREATTTTTRCCSEPRRHILITGPPGRRILLWPLGVQTEPGLADRGRDKRKKARPQQLRCCAIQNSRLQNQEQVPGGESPEATFHMQQALMSRVALLQPPSLLLAAGPRPARDGPACGEASPPSLHMTA